MQTDAVGRPAEASSGARWALALAAMLAMAVSYVDRQTMAVLAPTVRQTLDISPEQFGWLLAAFSFAYLVFAPLAGRLVDAVGARRGLLAAVLLWSAVAALHAVVPGFAMLFLLRIALGIAEAPSFPGAAQTVHRALLPAQRARGTGILFTGSSLGAVAAVLLAPWLQARWGLWVAFLGTAAMGLLWVPLWLATAWSATGRRLLDVQPAVSTSSGLAEALTTLRHPAVLRAMVLVMASAPMISFALNWMAEVLVRHHHLEQKDVRTYLWVPLVLFDVGSVAFGHAASVRWARSKGKPERALVAAAGLLAAGVATLPLLGQDPWATTLTASLALAGGGGLFALLTADMLGRVPARLVATAGGLTAAMQSVAYVIANPLIGRSFERTGSFALASVCLGLWVLPGCLAWILWAPPPPVTATADEASRDTSPSGQIG